MTHDLDDDGTIYKVVRNPASQYSIWPACKPNAAGWIETGVEGSKVECLAFVGKAWTDLRPPSMPGA